MCHSGTSIISYLSYVGFTVLKIFVLADFVMITGKVTRV